MRMPGYVPPSAASANWPMNPAVRPPPHAGNMLNRMPMPARQPMCIDPPMYGQQPAGVFQSVGPQGTRIFLHILSILISRYWSYVAVSRLTDSSAGDFLPLV